MKIFKQISTTLGLLLLLFAIAAVMPVYDPLERTQASQPVQECPTNTDKGAYHSRGYDKDGNISCGFTYFNECPYFAGAEAGTHECESNKPTPEQLKPWQPEQQPNPAPEKVTECGGK